jgi:hypothetical protein
MRRLASGIFSIPCALGSGALLSIARSHTINNLQVTDGCVSPRKYVHVGSTVGCIEGCEAEDALVATIHKTGYVIPRSLERSRATGVR